jgi:predicted DsbA family dithiol-disulfide isomerase
MRFRATTTDINPSTEGWMFLRDVQCPVCFAVYHLWSQFSDTDQSEINVHIDWLGQHLMDACPDHAADITTPEASEEKCQTYWLEEARAHAIHEAEDAGLRGIEREAFIQERTDTYYAGLSKKKSVTKPR